MKTITMSLGEYNFLSEENERMRNILGNEKSIGVHLRNCYSHNGIYTDYWDIVTKEDAVNLLANRVNELDKEIKDNLEELVILRKFVHPRNKHWWKLF